MARITFCNHSIIYNKGSLNVRRRGKRYLLAISAQTNQPTDQQERHAGKSEKLYGFSSPGSGTITNQHVSTDMRACMKASNIVSLSGIAFFSFTYLCSTTYLAIYLHELYLVRTYTYEHWKTRPSISQIYSFKIRLS